MKTKRRLLLVASAAALVIVGLALWLPHRHIQLYTVTVLPSLGGKKITPTDINDRRQIVGVAENSAGKSHHFLWDRSKGMQNLGRMLVFPNSYINNAGQIAGTTSEGGTIQPFLWHPKYSKKLLGTLNGEKSLAFGLNDRGQVVGRTGGPVGSYRAFIWDENYGMRPLPTPPKHTSRPRGINNAGQVVGYLQSDQINPRQVSCCWDSADPSAMPQTLVLPPDGYLTGNVINSNGYALCRAYYGDERKSWTLLWHKDEKLRRLFTIGFAAQGFVLNDANQVLFHERRSSPLERISRKHFPPYTQHLLWDPKRGKIVLDRQVPSEVGKLLRVVDINNRGCILAVIRSSALAREAAVLLEPIPERWDK
ncbi:MAG: hypothetical protein ACYSWQ_05970 [Planctomycetota bacterium]|jgi:probable HAF family extracellular repeat protein